MLEQRIQQQFFEGADLQYQTAEGLARPITEAVNAVVSALTAGGKLLLCGAGSGAWLARHAATLLVGHTAGSLLHGAMRLPLVTRPEDRELNSAGATLGSAGLGAAFAWGIAAAADTTITPWIILGGAALGAAPRLMEWMGGKALS